MSKAKKEKNEKREYLGWDDAPIVEWKAQKEEEGQKNWEERWGHGRPWMKRYNQWICSDISRAMRKPSFRSLEWLAYQRQWETAPEGEIRTRKKQGIKDTFVEPISYNCCPPPWPITTSKEVGWLVDCPLEIYPNDFMKLPPLPWHMKKISSFLANSQ